MNETSPTHVARPLRLDRLGPAALAYGLLLLATGVAVGPFLWMVATAVAPASEVFTPGLHLLPAHPTLANFARAWGSGNFPRLFANSLVVATAATLLNLLLDSLAAFAFARLEFRGKRALFALVLGTMMLPSVVTLVPLFLIVRGMPSTSPGGWLNTYPGIFMPGAASAFGIFLLRQYFDTLPRDLDEAAILDGCGPFALWWRVLLPLLRPALVTVAIFVFVGQWNDFLWPLMVANDSAMYTLQVGLSEFTSEHTIDWPLLMAASTLVVVPVLAIYLALQRFFVQGVALSGLKE